MAQEYKVTKAFQATVSKEDQTPKSFTNKAGQKLFVWKVQFEGRSDWIDINKQEGNEIKAGDSLYGNLVEEQVPWGTKLAFKSEQRPMGEYPASQGSAPLTPAPAVGSALEAKIDRILEVVEILAGIREEALAAFDDAPTAVPANGGLDDLDI